MPDNEEYSKFWNMFPHLGLGGIPPKDREAFVNYVKSGGAYGYEEWKRKGKPSPPTALSAYSRGILEQAGKTDYLKGTTTAKATPSEEIGLEKRKKRKATEEAEGILGDVGGFGGAGAGFDNPGDAVGKVLELEKQTGESWTIRYDETTGRYLVVPGLTETEQRAPTKYEPFGQDPYGGQGQWNPYTGRWEKPAGWTPPAAKPTTYPMPEGMQDPYGGKGQWNPYTGQWEKPAGWMDPYQRQTLDLQRQQLEQEMASQQSMIGWYREKAEMERAEQERQYKAQLMASPMSWLQYSSYTGETPAVQPWMLPLSASQYGWTSAGQPMSQAQGGDLSNLPSLRSPSMQYLQRMGPTAQKQWMGYQQASSGATPEESIFRVQSRAAPGGAYSGLRWNR